MILSPLTFPNRYAPSSVGSQTYKCSPRYTSRRIYWVWIVFDDTARETRKFADAKGHFHGWPIICSDALRHFKYSTTTTTTAWRGTSNILCVYILADFPPTTVFRKWHNICPCRSPSVYAHYRARVKILPVSWRNSGTTIGSRKANMPGRWPSVNNKSRHTTVA